MKPRTFVGIMLLGLLLTGCTKGKPENISAIICIISFAVAVFAAIGAIFFPSNDRKMVSAGIAIVFLLTSLGILA